jgi:molybdopterin molybdotransferase
MAEGSDTLIPIENGTAENGKIIINEEVPYGFSVREVGENFKKGEVLITKGTKIDFAQIAVLASLNCVEVSVFEKPKVAIIATGSELLELGEEQTKFSQIRSSNNYTIEAIAKENVAKPIALGCIGDDIDNIKSVFKNALKEADIIVSTGGVSVGDFDFVKDVVRDELGAEVLFKGVVLKPGQHIMVAKVDNKIILALPGFAYSSTVTALLYLLPVIYKYMQVDYKPLIVKAKLKEKYRKKSKKTEFAPCNIFTENGEICVDFKNKKDGTSAIMTNMLGNTALVVTAADETDKNAEEYIDTFIYNLNIKVQ